MSIHINSYECICGEDWEEACNEDCSDVCLNCGRTCEAVKSETLESIHLAAEPPAAQQKPRVGG